MRQKRVLALVGEGSKPPRSLEGLTDEQVSEFAKESFAIQNDRLKLKKKYFNKVSKAVAARIRTAATRSTNRP